MLKELETPPAGSFAKIADLDGMRRVLGKAAGSIDPTEKAAASRVMQWLDNYLSNIPKPDVIQRMYRWGHGCSSLLAATMG